MKMNNYVFHTTYDEEEIDKFVMASEQNSLFQCSEWAYVKENWNHLFTCVTSDDKIIASALVLVRHMPLGKTLFYIPRGPVLDYKNKELLSFYMNELTVLARKHKAIAIRFDPAILSRKYSYKERNEDNPFMNEDVISSLKDLGCIHKGMTIHIEEATQPRFNAEMDVDEDYESKLEHKTMKCVRSAIHKGIQVRSGKDKVHDLAIAMHYTEVRKKVALRNESYFEHMMDVYEDHAICMVSYLNFKEQIQNLETSIQEKKDQLEQNPSKKQKATLEREIAQDEKELTKLQEDYAREGTDEVITSGILACYNDTLMELFYMGNNPNYLRMYSSYLLYKKCLDICVEKGIHHCSFGGIEGTLDDGLTLFKSNWLMNVEEYIGEFNLVLNKPMYYLFDTLYPQLLKTVAKLRGMK